MRKQSMYYRNRGFGIVEVMVAITIGLILLAGAISMLSTNKWTYSVVEHQSRIQENARFALETIARDLRMAGYFGCLDNISKVTNHLNGATGGSLLDSSIPVDGLDNYAVGDAWSPSGSTTVPPNIVAGSDAIGIRYLDPNTAVSVVPPLMPNNSAALHTAPGNNLAVGEIVAVTDCDNADIFQITGPQDPNATGTFNHNTGSGDLPGNASKEFAKAYEDDARILKMASVTYYIGTGADGRPALFRGVIPATGDMSVMDTRELIQGVEQMHILYGKDTTGDNVPDTYLNAGAAGLTTDVNWDSVVNLRIAIMVSTDEEIGRDVDNQARTLLDEAVPAANDRRFRRVFTTTINMRNKASAS